MFSCAVPQTQHEFECLDEDDYYEEHASVDDYYGEQGSVDDDDEYYDNDDGADDSIEVIDVEVIGDDEDDDDEDDEDDEEDEDHYFGSSEDIFEQRAILAAVEEERRLAVQLRESINNVFESHHAINSSSSSSTNNNALPSTSENQPEQQPQQPQQPQPPKEQDQVAVEQISQDNDSRELNTHEGYYSDEQEDLNVILTSPNTGISRLNEVPSTTTTPTTCSSANAKKKLDPNASTFIFNPTAATFVPTFSATTTTTSSSSSAITLDEATTPTADSKKKETITYPPWFLMQFQPTCFDAPVELPPDIDITLDPEYMMNYYYEEVNGCYDQGEYYGQYFPSTKERDENVIRYDPLFLLSLKELNTSRPEDMVDSEVVLGCEAAPQEDPTKKKMELSVTTTTTTTDASDADLLTTPKKLSKSAKKKKKAAAAAAAAASAGNNNNTPCNNDADNTALSISTPFQRTKSDAFSTPSSCVKKLEGSLLPRCSSEPAVPTPGRWRPAMAQTEDAIAAKTMRSVLNKLTPEKFDKLFSQVLDIEITQSATLDCIMGVVVEKASAEAAFSGMYSDLVVRMSKEMKLPAELDFMQSLRARTLNWFLEHDRSQVMPSAEDLAALSAEDQEMAKIGAKSKWMGLTVLLAELYKRGLLSSECIDQIWAKLSSTVSSDAAEDDDAETLCTFLSHAGEALEEHRDDLSGDFYECLQRISSSSSSSSFTTRIRFMAQGLLELRKAKWVPRRKAVVNPQKLSNIHAEICSPKTIKSPKNNRDSHFTPKSNSNTPASSSGKWDRNSWEEEMARERKLRIEREKRESHQSPSSFKTPSRKTTSSNNSSKKEATTPSNNNNNNNSNNGTPASASKWDRNSWEEEMARERKLRIEREKRENSSNNSSSSKSFGSNKRSPSTPFIPRLQTKHSPAAAAKFIHQPNNN